jgi:hypothetical protein
MKDQNVLLKPANGVKTMAIKKKHWELDGAVKAAVTPHPTLS